MSRTLISDTQPPLFHPSQFETTMADTPQGTRSIRELEREHTKRLNTDDLNHLQSPGTFHLTDKLNDEIASRSNSMPNNQLFILKCSLSPYTAWHA